MKRFGFLGFLVISLAIIALPVTNIWAQIENPPAIADQYNSDKMCNLGDFRNLQIIATGDSLVYSILNGPGDIDSLSGIISYIPDTSGVFVFEVMVSNSLGNNTAFVTDSLILNSPPQVFCYDSTVYLCQQEEITFDVYALDVDGDALEIKMLEGLGSFNMINDTSGEATFLPADLDSAVYQFIFRGSDNCDLTQPTNKSLAICCADTSLITVVINRGPTVENPGEQNYFICGDSSFSFDFVATDPENEELTITINTDEAHASQISLDGQTISVIANITEQFEITIMAVDSCGHADTVTVPINIIKNSAPYVTTASDFEMTFCLPEIICFDAFADDPDFNIENVTANFGNYDPSTQRICFEPDTAGLYYFVLTATDACGLVDSSVTYVTVIFNDTPVIDLGEDFASTVCIGEEICITPNITDDNLDRVLTNFGFYNVQNGQICFTPDTSGHYVLAAEVNDFCGVIVYDTLEIDVLVKDAPTLDIGENLTLALCDIEEICIDVLTNVPNGVSSNLGSYNDQTGQICFTPDTAGVYTLDVIVTDDCDLVAQSSITIDVSYKQAPTISGFEDQNVYLCKPIGIDMPITITDLDNDIASVIVSRGSYSNGMVTFVPYDSGTYEITVTVTDSCGNIAVDTATVNVSTDQNITITVPNDTSLFVCELDTLAFPVYGIPDNATVEVTGINTWYDETVDSIYFLPECAVSNNIVITVTTECNTFVEEFNVTVICNTPPLVILPPDSNIFLCNIEEIQIPLGISDVDNNIIDISVEGGVYDNVMNLISFTPEASGVYTISVTATDSCQATDFDEIIITVELNETPVCQIPSDTTIILCDPAQISLPVSAFDANGNLTEITIISGPGQIVDGNWIYNAAVDDAFQVVIQSIDECNSICTDSFTVNLQINEAPICEIPNDTSIFLCDISEVILPVSATDGDNDLIGSTILDGPGEIIDGNWVYTPNGSETVSVTIQFSDECGHLCQGTFTVNFTVNEAPVCLVPNDTSIFMCDISEVSLPYSYSDATGSVTCEIIDGPGQLIDGNWVYTPVGDETVTVTIRCTDDCGLSCESSFTVNFDINEAPVTNITGDQIIYICTPYQITTPVSATDADGNLLGITIVSGPGEIVNGNWLYTPTAEEIVTVTIRSEDECGAFSEKSFTFDITINDLPQIADQSYSENFCLPNELRNINVIADDIDDTELTYKLLSGVGTIDPATGIISYNPDTSGTYTFEVSVSDDCGTVSAVITDVIGINNPPVLNGLDSLVNHCNVGPVEYTFTAYDFDGDDITIEMVTQFGVFTQIQNDTGHLIFTPLDVDSAQYIFVFSVTDACGAFPEKSMAPILDTVIITVLINQLPVFVDPGPQNFFTCQLDTFDFHIEANDPDFEPLTYTITNADLFAGNVYLEGQTVYVIGNQSEQFDIQLQVTDSCGHIDNITVPVVVEGNRPPVVNSADDFDILLCTPQTVCLSVTADDPDFNLALVTSNIGNYNADNQQVCFDADTTGIYTVITTAIDDCDIEHADTTYVTVNLNNAPVVNLGDDLLFNLCVSEEICLDVEITDENLNMVTINFGIYNSETGQLCFTPDTSGTYQIIVTALDDCELSFEDTILVTVSISEGPFVELGADIAKFQCEPSEICLDVATVDNLSSVITSDFAYYNSETGQICFTPDTAGIYTLNIDVTDTCGLTATDFVNVTVDYNSVPTVFVSTDVLIVNMCTPEEICLNVSYQDIDNNFDSYQINYGTYDPDNSLVCFTPDTSGIYTITVTAIDECGAQASETVEITVTINESPIVDLGDDFGISLCALEDVCFDATIFDNSLTDLTISFGTYDEAAGTICFAPDTSGVYQFIATATDDCDVTVSDTIYVTVSIAEGPFVNLGEDYSLTLCDYTEVCVDVNTIINYSSMTTSLGSSYNEQTGQLCFTPDTAGVYKLSVEVSDTCGAIGYDEINITIDYNQTPEILTPLADTTIYLCKPTSIVIPFEYYDAGNAQITVNRGSYENGAISFVPYDSGYYEIIATITDDCGQTIADTCQVHVITDQSISITVPNDTTLFVCELDTLCYPILGIPEGATVEVSGINTWFDYNTNSVCFFPECAVSNTITVTVSTDCNSFENQFTVNVICNTKPLVILPPDTTMLICNPGEICLPVGIGDVDKNISIVTANGGYYDDVFSKLCFNADTSGLYILSITATDSCGAADTDEIAVMVEINSAPEITYNQITETLLSCQGGIICLPIDITDVNNNILSISTSLGSYDSQTGEICFTPDTSGTYCAVVTVIDSCGLETTYTACADVRIGDVVTFECPELFTPDSLCTPGQLTCIPFDIIGNGVTVITSLGTYENGELCFNPDTAGLYTISVTASTECNTITCEISIQINIKEELIVTCPPSIVDTLICPYDTLMYFDYEITSSVENLEVSSPAYFLDSQIVYPVSETGNYTVTLIGSGECGADTCSFDINVRVNSAPVVTASDTTLTVCELDSICIPFEAVDIDGNILNYYSPNSKINGNEFCFLPENFGTTEINIFVTDECGTIGQAIVMVTINVGDSANILTCPTQQFETVCELGTICDTLIITPVDANIIILDNGQPAANAVYNPLNGELCYDITEVGKHDITVIAEADCSSDTCSYELTVNLSQPPTASAPANIAETLCLVTPDTVCYPVTITGTGLQITVSPVGKYEAGFVCVPIDTAGLYIIEITASNDCGTKTVTTEINIDAEEAPKLYLPADISFDWCPQDEYSIIIDGIYATDNNTLVSLTQSCGLNSMNLVSTDSGYISFVPDSAGSYEFCFEAYDGCATVSGSFFVDIFEKEDCDICVLATIESGSPVPVGVHTDISINVATNNTIGGFDLLISYDASVLAFINATIIETEIDAWEYFNFRIGSNECGPSCPSGMVRFVGIADVNNGNAHPSIESLNPQGELIRITYQISNDQNLGDQFLPINFFWFDCGDNTFSNTTGTILYMDSRIYTAEYNLLWDEDDDINYPSEIRPFGLGSIDECLIGASSQPIRCIEFVNGGVHVIHPDSIDDRGDINLNSIAYEIADAVMYSNYFIYGFSVFNINLAGQIAASDCNADGLTLSVADLVLLIRVIIGDADPIPKLVPFEQALKLTSERTPNTISVLSNSESDIGGALIAYELDEDISIESVELSGDAKNMDLMYDVVDGQLRMLIYNIGTNMITKGSNHLIDINYSGNGNMRLVETEFVSYSGRQYNVVNKTGELPTGFDLGQNYPNPFNPTTTINLALPYPSKWSLSIYNIQGQLIRRFEGADMAGTFEVEWNGLDNYGSQTASGIYLYRFEAGDFTDSKKMILLK